MTDHKSQVCIIHGGNVFESHDAYRQSLAEQTVDYERLLYAPSWKNWLAEQLPNHDVLMPSMPGRDNASYDEWATYFSKIVPYLRPDAVLIGHSLGGVFLAKYLSEHPPMQPYVQLILIAAPYDDESAEPLGGFRLSGVSNLPVAAQQIHLFYSSDDPVVAFSEKDRYKADIPSAFEHLFDDRQHFNTSEFRELLELLR